MSPRIWEEEDVKHSKNRCPSRFWHSSGVDHLCDLELGHGHVHRDTAAKKSWNDAAAHRSAEHQVVELRKKLARHETDFVPRLNDLTAECAELYQAIVVNRLVAYVASACAAAEERGRIVAYLRIAAEHNPDCPGAKFASALGDLVERGVHLQAPTPACDPESNAPPPASAPWRPGGE